MTKELKVLGAFIFTGSATIGVMQNGVKVDKVLELTDGMPEDNAKSFIHNYPEIPVVIPSVWDTPEYLEELKKEEYDFLYANPPCSGLSLGAPGKQSHEKGPNCHMYTYMRLIDTIKPKAFMFENAPTLVSTGKPILNDYVQQLKDYNFTVIRDFGMYHGVAMKRQRTFLMGWRKDVFNEIPVLHMDKQPTVTVEDVIGDLYDVELGSVTNHDYIPNRPFQEIEWIFPEVPVVKSGIYTAHWVICNNWEKYSPMLSEKYKKSIATQLYKQNHGLGYWDKSAQRVDKNGQAPSLTGYSCFIHPVHNRQFTVLEYKRLMGYPDTFEILETKVGKDMVRHIAQGVPAPFYKYASGEVLAALRGERTETYGKETEVVFQHHGKEVAYTFTKESFVEEPKIGNLDKKLGQKLTK
jgi:DNA (cytosine-5)-methyltransferase 1